MNRTIRNLRIRGMLPAGTAVELDASSALLTKELTGGYDADPNLGGAPAIIQNAELGTEFREETAAKFWRKTETAWEEAGGGGIPGGSDTELQVNTSGTFGGAAGVTYDGNLNIASGVDFIPSGSGIVSTKTGGNSTSTGVASTVYGEGADGPGVNSTVMGRNAGGNASQTAVYGAEGRSDATGASNFGFQSVTLAQFSTGMGHNCQILAGAFESVAAGHGIIVRSTAECSSSFGVDIVNEHKKAIVLGKGGISTADNRMTVGPAADAIDLEVFGGIGLNGTTPLVAPSVTGSRGGNAALADLLTVLASFGLITDSTTA